MKLISHDNSLECHHPNNDDDRRVCMYVCMQQAINLDHFIKGHSQHIYTYERLRHGVFVLTNILCSSIMINDA